MSIKKLKVRSDLFQIIISLLLCLTLTVCGFILPLRPTFSDSEKRELAKFPAFSFAALFDGSYFRNIDTWFSDTFPFREQWISGNAQVKQYYGISINQVHGELEESDDIPEVNERPTLPVLPSTEATTTAPITEATTSAMTTTQSATQKGEVMTDPPIKTQNLGAVLVAGNTGYEYYNFNRTEADRYTNALNKLSAQLNGKAKLYEMVVPTSIGITLDDSIKKSVNSSDQKKAIDYMYSRLNTSINVVDIYDTMLNHRNEYIYFNTDHHWTALGAYYAYEQFMIVAGKEVTPILNYDTVDYDGFLGSFYTDTGKNAALGKNPDTVTAYLPSKNAKMTITNKSGGSFSWPIISDVTKSSASYKYLTFIGGDNPYSVIHNSDITDGSSCLVVKESFGNAFVPFLTNHYQTVHVIDYRYYNTKINDFVTKHKVQDVLFINNISATRSKMLVSDIVDIIG
ncbi:MAG: hypothetical protein IJF54_06705 [Clostridia bacterium]|nr:hypothetical protein [Clostridia bacterium]